VNTRITKLRKYIKQKDIIHGSLYTINKKDKVHKGPEGGADLPPTARHQPDIINNRFKLLVCNL